MAFKVAFVEGNPLGSTGLPSPPSYVRGGAGSSGFGWRAGEQMSRWGEGWMDGGRLERVGQGFSSLVRAVGSFCLPPSEGEC